jgi:glycosyltransferase involved in cell wall biosynthesis
MPANAAAPATRILYQGLLRSSASWARVGRGYLKAFVELGVDAAAVSPRGFGYRPDFPIPAGIIEQSAAEARRLEPPDLGLGFLHPPEIHRLIGRRRWNLFVWESDLAPAAWMEPMRRGAERIVSPSAFTRDALAASGLDLERILVLPYGHDLPGGEARPAPGPEGRPFTFLAVLAPHRRKGIRELLLAYRRAFDARDGVRLRIKTGYDPGAARARRAFEIPSWRAALAEAGLDRAGAPAVEVAVSTIADAEMPALLAAADVAVQPSWGESFGLAVLEALAAGLPAITTAWGGPLEFHPGGGDLVPYRLEAAGDALYEAVPGARAAIPDIEALSARMRWHYEHPDASRRLGDAARSAVAGWTWREAARRLLEAFDGAAAVNGRRRRSGP